MNFGNLTLALVTIGPVGYAIGWAFGWLLRVDTPSLFGISVGLLFIWLGMRGGNGGSSSDDKRTHEFMDTEPEDRTTPDDAFDNYKRGILRDDRFGSHQPSPALSPVFP